ncbi:hypothetical protein ABPG74_014937 [Tetrahymena malaccensis]
MSTHLRQYMKENQQGNGSPVGSSRKNENSYANEYANTLQPAQNPMNGNVYSQQYQAQPSSSTQGSFVKQNSPQLGSVKQNSHPGHSQSGSQNIYSSQTNNHMQSHSAAKRQNSQSSLDGPQNQSRRFSLFSKSSFATSTSFLFRTSGFHQKNNKSVPKVDICNIFKKKAYLYLDEALANTFDDLLDKGYTIVNAKKEERDIMKEQEEAMKEEAQLLEKEIVPLINASTKVQEQIIYQQQLSEKYQSEIDSLCKELDELKDLIEKRSEEIQNNHDDLTNAIKQAELMNNEIRAQININKANHRQLTNQLEKAKKQKEQEQSQLVIQLNEYKKQYEEKKLSQADKLRKMENKSKMYLGILKH